MGISNISNEKTEVNAPRTSTSQLQRTLACRKAKCHIDNIKDFIVRLRVSYYSPFTRSEYCLSLVIYAEIPFPAEMVFYVLEEDGNCSFPSTYTRNIIHLLATSICCNCPRVYVVS